MTARDELREIIRNVLHAEVAYPSAWDAADAILAAGWRAPTPPAHVISCTCRQTDPKTWTRYGGAIEPGSVFEPDPYCQAHEPKGSTGMNALIPRRAMEAAKAAMREVTPPPGVTKADWLAEHGGFALIAGAIAAAAQHIHEESYLEGWDTAKLYYKGDAKPRTIKTAEELDALPNGSVILDSVGLSLHKNEFAGWRASNGAKQISAEMLAREALPATVLYEPEPTK